MFYRIVVTIRIVRVAIIVALVGGLGSLMAVLLSAA